ncbi:glycosyltransferase family 2 protein [Candidatus Chlorohelix sp.]|uniref:glycosyltransferase family 2 protein n=1 Tax=Candidatus Chlorohelix sp. TaxID=3139201 RepID=UPI003073858F
MDLSIIVVSYNTVNLTRKCLASVFSNPHPRYTFEIIVVDNASRDATPLMIRDEFPQVKLVANSDNRGFAAANNQGYAQAQGDYILLLNPDTEVIGDSIWKMLDFSKRTRDAGVVAPSLVYPDDSFQHSVFRFPSLWQIFLDFIPINWRFTESGLNGRYPRRMFEGAPFKVDFPLGACMLFNRTVIEQNGFMDEQFWMYMEEIDLCYRVRQAGWEIFCVPSARIVHHAGASSRQFRDEMFFQLHKSRALFYQKHHALLFRLAAKCLTLLGLSWLTIKATWARFSGKMESGEFSSRLRGYKRVAGLQLR